MPAMGIGGVWVCVRFRYPLAPKEKWPLSNEPAGGELWTCWNEHRHRIPRPTSAHVSGDECCCARLEPSSSDIERATCSTLEARSTAHSGMGLYRKWIIERWCHLKKKHDDNIIIMNYIEIIPKIYTTH